MKKYENIIAGIEPVFDNFYVKGDAVGIGSYGKVYKIYNIKSHNWESVKIIDIKRACELKYKKDDNDFYDEELKRYEDIIKKVRECSEKCDYIIKYLEYKYDKDEYILYIRMPLFQSFKSRYLDENDRSDMTIDDIWKLTIQMLLALIALNDVEKNLVHGDIKLENILVDSQGDFCLTDFGELKERKQINRETVFTDIKRGTELTMSPEIFGYEKGDCRSDLYSLGIIIFHCLSKGLYPEQYNHTEREWMAYFIRKMRGEYEVPIYQAVEEFFPGVLSLKVFKSEDEKRLKKLCKFVSKCCKYKPSDRYISPQKALEYLVGKGFKSKSAPVSSSVNNFHEKGTQVFGEEHKFNAKKTQVFGEEHKFNAKKTQVFGEEHKFNAKETQVFGEGHKFNAKETKVFGKEDKFTAKETKVFDAGDKDAFNTTDESKGKYIVGNKFKFGKFNNKQLEWQIIRDNGDGSALVVSTESIFERLFKKEICINENANYWAGSDVRQYLNNEFYNYCFSDEEKKKIKISEIKTEFVNRNIYGIINETKFVTKDYIFLLSKEEVENIPEVIRNIKSSWWLRTPDRIDSDSVCIYNSKHSVSIANKSHGIRPAFNFKLK